MNSTKLRFDSSNSSHKLVIIGIASLLWLVVIVQRLPASIAKNDDIGIDTSWVVGLPAALAQHYLSGRDFHFMYGPLAQVITWFGARLHSPWSPIDSLPLILLAFTSTSILFLGLVLFLLKELDAQKCIFLYACIVALNLFSEPTSFRVLGLILVAALVYRALISDSSSRMLAWAAAAGAVAVIAQLISVELGPYAVIVAIAATSLQTLRKKRLHDLLPCCTTVMATYFLGNLAISTAFVLSSPNYHFFDYQRFSFALMRGYNYAAGIPWELGRTATAVLAVITLFTIASAAWMAMKFEVSALIIPLILASLITLKSAVTRSDLGHITQSASPLIFTFLVMGSLFFSEKRTRYTFGSAWAVLFVALVLTWPWSRRLFPVDLIDGITHSPFAKLAKLATATSDPKQILPAGWTFNPIDAQRPMLPFPHELYIPVALHQPLAAPVFQSFLASPQSLQNFYVNRVEALGRNLDVAYSVNDWDFDGVQAISRVPQIFEYLYRNFSLSEPTGTGCNYCTLERDATRFELKTAPIRFQIARTSGGLEIHPEGSSPCSLLQLTLQLDYSVGRFLGHVMPVDVTVSRAESVVIHTGLVPLEVNAPFSTYVSLIPPNRFYTVFRHQSVPQFSWDKLRIDPRSADWAGISPSSIRLQGMNCVTI